MAIESGPQWVSIFLTQLVGQIPLFIVYLGGMILAMILWGRQPRASLLLTLGLGTMLRERFGALRDVLRRERLQVTRRRSVAEFAGEALAILGVFGVLAAMGYSALAGVISVGTLIMYHGALQKAWTSLGQVLRGISILYEDNLFVSDLFEFLEVEPRVHSPAEPRPL